MKVKCINNQVSAIPKKILKDFIIQTEFLCLKEGKEYLVYATSIYFGYVWFCIYLDEDDIYPRWMPSMLFELTDSCLSRYWIFGLREAYEGAGVKKVPFLSFPEWTNDLYFYEDLIDECYDEPNTVIVTKYKELMYLEFPDPSITAIAQIGDEEWLMCQNCIDAWQSKNDRDALVKCPKCQTIYNNPRYKDVPC